MNNVYREVQSVVGRVTGAGGARGGRRGRSALLLNCHFDTVPDSPGASDDAAGCAVVLEVARALAASRAPLRHDVIFLLNGAEENIMQASHAFITRHPWAGAVRAFINIEACGAGGREVLFQAGPHDPWLVEEYARAVPHPFASSLAQELFESGLIPADTDFRVFRDFGGLSGLDLAWSSDGYVYHTRLDTAERVPLGSLQRTGDNVLALARALLASGRLATEVELTARQPVFFDVLGVLVVCARAPLAAAAALAALALAALHAYRHARAAHRRLYVGAREWGWRVLGALVVWVGAHLCGAACSAAVALALHAAGARLSFYARPWLLAPLYALPALAGCWGAAGALWRRRLGGRGATRGWWGARCMGCACVAVWAATLLTCLLLRLRSGFLPLLWTVAPAAATLGVPRGAGWPLRWALGAALPTLQTCYLALGSLHMFVPMMGRAGTPPLPADVTMALLVATLALGACGWMLPLVVAAREPRGLLRAMWTTCAVAALAVCVLRVPAYDERRPQRVMVFHVRRTWHEAGAHRTEHLYWVPQLDANTPHSVFPYECARAPYCGAPYYLPVLSLVGASHWAPAPPPPAEVEVRVRVSRRSVNESVEALLLEVEGPLPAHVVAIVAPEAGGAVAWSSAVDAPVAGPLWGARRTYFFALHDARPAPARRPWALEVHVAHAWPRAAAVTPCAWLSVAGHALGGARAPDHARLLRALPAWTAPTGWPVDLHLLHV
ncbi:hypothetical protein K1T71_010542 [Dendrolimus kikuchii]|uniref:Uncharacterized protein n=1 Tax=Dendrolimus kikuchii TaxID=765133 RepID=A0ACC1CS87_9NEOP|nr:hypothetical protein K1T71_010542 [Dendrolimus kikuchii]